MCAPRPRLLLPACVENNHWSPKALVWREEGSTTHRPEQYHAFRAERLRTHAVPPNLGGAAETLRHSRDRVSGKAGRSRSFQRRWHEVRSQDEERHRTDRSLRDERYCESRLRDQLALPSITPTVLARQPCSSSHSTRCKRQPRKSAAGACYAVSLALRARISSSSDWSHHEA